MSSFLQPHGLKPARLLCAWDFPGQNTGVGSHSVPLQGISLTQGSNPHFLLGRQILYHWATKEALFVQKGENTGLAKKIRFFHNIVQKNPNEPFAQPNTHLESLWKDIQKITDAHGCYRGERGQVRMEEGILWIWTSQIPNSEYWALSNNTKTKHPHLHLSWTLACVRLISVLGTVLCFLFLVFPCYCCSFFPFPSFLRLMEFCYLFPLADGKSVPTCASLACWQRRFRVSGCTRLCSGRQSSPASFLGPWVQTSLCENLPRALFPRGPDYTTHLPNRP